MKKLIIAFCSVVLFTSIATAQMTRRATSLPSGTDGDIQTKNGANFSSIPAAKFSIDPDTGDVTLAGSMTMPTGQSETQSLKVGTSPNYVIIDANGNINFYGEGGMNWTDVQLAASGINWVDFQLATSGINWVDFQLATSGINWVDFQLAASGINWLDLQLAASGANWIDMAMSQSGINWSDADMVKGSVNIPFLAADNTSDITGIQRPFNFVATSIDCITVGGTSVTGTFDNCDSAGANCNAISADLTCTAGNKVSTSTLYSTYTTFTAGTNTIGWHTTSVSGTNTHFSGGLNFNRSGLSW